MWPYFALLVLATLGILSSDSGRRWEPLAWLTFGVLLAALIGFRYRVGGDWGFEHNLFWRIQGLSFVDALTQADPGFAFIGWLVADSGLNVWTLNLVCGAIFTIGLLSFCRTLPDPWLAVAVAIPYLVIVVAMGYSRQSVAIGFFLLALVKLQAGFFFRFLVFMALACSMHITAALLVPICILASRRRKFKSLVFGIAASLGLFIYFLQGSVDSFVDGYIEARYESSGALIRILMNALPSALFLLNRSRMVLDPDTSRLWSVFSLIGLAFVVLLAVSPSSTAVDRMALYFIPVQLFVWSRLPLALARSPAQQRDLTLGVVVYSACVLFVWLNYADSSYSWIPFQLFPYESLWGVSD